MQNTRIGSGAQKMAYSLMGGNGIENKSFANTLAAKMAMAAKMAQADKYNSETALNNQRLENMDVGNREFMQGATGLSQPQLQIMNMLKKSGQYHAPQRASGPPTAGGEEPSMMMPSNEKPEWLTPDISSKYDRARMASGANKMGTGKSNADHIMKALINAATLNRQDEMIDGNLNPARVAPAMAASEGKPMVNVTGSGIGYNPYGSTDNLNTKPFIEKANIDAKAKVDAVLARGGVNGGQLPAEAKMVNFYISKGFPKEKAIEMARSRKNVPLRVLAADIYATERDNLMLSPEARNMSPEQQEMFVQDRVIKTMQFLQNNEDRFGGNDSPPIAGAQKAPDGNWYVNKNGKWFKVDK